MNQETIYVLCRGLRITEGQTGNTVKISCIPKSEFDTEGFSYLCNRSSNVEEWVPTADLALYQRGMNIKVN